jgi:hypothetical protein
MSESESFVVTSTRKSFGPFSSLKALIAPNGNKAILGAYERPPFPIIIDSPTPRDLLHNLQLSDFVMGGTLYGTGILWSFVISRPFP